MKSSVKRFRLLMITLFIILMALCVGFSVFFAACNKDEKNENNDEGEETVTTVESISISPSTLSLKVGDTKTLTVAVEMKKDHDAVDFTYSPAESEIVSIEKGVDKLIVTGVAEGSVTITVIADGVSASCDVTVTGASSSSDEKKYEWVDTEADLETAMNLAGGNASKISGESLTVGKFTFGVGAYFEDTENGVKGYFDVNTQSTTITFEVTGLYNNISFHGYRTTSGTSVTYTLYSASDMTEAIYAWEPFEDGDADYYKSTGKYLEAGTYVISPSSAARVYNIKVSEYVEESDPKGITAIAATTDFLMGRNIEESDLGIIVTLAYENGRSDTITSGYSTDLSTVSLDAGPNEITVTYSPGGGGHEFECTVTIYCYETQSIEISDFSMEYTGGTYYTNNVQKIYLVGGTVSYQYAAVTATALYGSGTAGRGATFILTSDEVNFKTTDSTGNAVTGAFTAAGEYTVTATVNVALADDVTNNYTVNVVDATGASTTEVNVDQTAAVGVDGETNVVKVNTIVDAIYLIKLLGAPDDVRKTITVDEGTYIEKIYIDIPNLSIIGSNSEEETDLATRQETTEIMYGAMNGVMDPSGTTTYSTVGSATVTVAKEAVGFYAANITFRNYWNTNALYNEALKITSSTQADAAYINADKSYFYNVTFTGYHDTLEAENGRQYYDHCYIEGRTDYIFGNTATCYFDSCSIHTIGAGDNNNGGYVMAIKGTGVEYGYIFNNCAFTTDLEKYYEGAEVADDFKYTVEGTVAVARTWSGSDMHIAILNSSFDAGFSKEAYVASTGKGASGKNSRYTHMTSGQAPTPAYLVEYNNTGEGAISESIEGTCTVYTQGSEVTNYTDFSKIFANVNGSVKYGDDWSGASVELVVATVEVGGENYTVTGYKGSLTVADVLVAVNAQLSGQAIETLYDVDNQPVDAAEKISENVTYTASAQEADMTVPASVTYDFSGTENGSVTESGWLGYLYFDIKENGSFASNGYSWYLLDNATITVKLSAGSSIEFQVSNQNSIDVDKTENVTSEVTAAVEGVTTGSISIP